MVVDFAKDPAPPATLLQQTPLAILPDGTDVISSKQWNNLIDILFSGLLTDRIVLAALVAGTNDKFLVMRAGTLGYDSILVADVPTLTRAKISDFLPITKSDVEDTGTWNVAEIPDLPESKITNLITDLAGKEPSLPSMIGNALKFLRVNAGETGKEWVTVAGGSGTDEVLLVPTANKTIPANTSIIVGDYYRLGSGIGLTIESGANLTVI